MVLLEQTDSLYEISQLQLDLCQDINEEKDDQIDLMDIQIQLHMDKAIALEQEISDLERTVKKFRIKTGFLIGGIGLTGGLAVWSLVFR